MNNKTSKTRALVECAIMIAIGTVLAQIKIFSMPFGGSVTLVSLLPLILVSFRHGLKWGLLAGFINSLLQMLLGFYAPPSGTITALIGMILLDYLLAFMVLGTACIFAKPFKKQIIGVGVGCATVCFLRFLCSFLSGALIWHSYQSSYEWAVGLSVWEYSFVYNGSYMFPELIITTVVACLVCAVAPQLFSLEKQCLEK